MFANIVQAIAGDNVHSSDEEVPAFHQSRSDTVTSLTLGIATT